MGLVELVELEIAQRARAERAEVALMRRARIVYRCVGVAGEIDYLRVVYKNIRYLVLAPVDAAVDGVCNVRVLEEKGMRSAVIEASKACVKKGREV